MPKKVLILDDDYSFAFEIINKSTQDNMIFSVADSIDSAQRMLDGQRYDLLLANTQVPGGCSYSFMKNFHDVQRKPKVVFMSSIEKEYARINNLGEVCVKKNEIHERGIYAAVNQHNTACIS